MLTLYRTHRTERFEIQFFEKRRDIPYIDDCHHPLAKEFVRVVCIRQLDRGSEFWLSLTEYLDLVRGRKRGIPSPVPIMSRSELESILGSTP